MESSDLVAQLTFVGVDDREWRDEKRRAAHGRSQRRKLADEPPPLPDGPCCGRCAFWVAPDEAGGFGACRILAIVTERTPGGPERGTAMSAKEARFEGWTWGPLAMRRWAEGCSAFKAKSAEIAA
jgi:hypothetical protein